MTKKTPFRMNRRQALTGIAAVGVSLNIPKELLAAGGKVNFYNWDTYIGETTLEDFTKATGIEVQYDLFADNDELFAKLKNGNPGYDLIVPTNDFVERMIQADMLMTLDHSKIPNIANIDPGFTDPAFDPGRKYSLPYMWGSIGIGYRKSA
ncbi:MAG: extracellular solute-binding protein, partial [Pseudomonadota bacterium]